MGYFILGVVVGIVVGVLGVVVLLGRSEVVGQCPNCYHVWLL